MKNVLVATIICALIPSNSFAEQPTSDVMRTLDAVANDLCQRPTMYGYTKTQGASVTGSLDLPGLLKKLLNVGLSATAKTESTNWKGVLQQDAARALANSNNCRTEMFRLMLEKLSIAPSSAPAINQVHFVADGTGPNFAPPKLNHRTLDGCMVKPENPSGDGCSVQDTQTIAAQFCKASGFLSARTYRTEMENQFQASYKLTRKVDPSGLFHYVWNEDDSGGYIISYVECHN
jgi:hypothetical protein